MNNPYKTLGVTPGASLKTIKKSYQEKVLRSHPDVGGTVIRMQSLNKAMEFFNFWFGVLHRNKYKLPPLD